jgi:hypothetical protein
MMTKAEEKRFLKRFKRMLIESSRVTKEARALINKWDESKKKKLKKVI